LTLADRSFFHQSMQSSDNSSTSARC